MTHNGISRLFLAINPPEEIIGKITVVQKRLQKSLAGDIRWVKPVGMHLTLKFFGDVFNREIGEISAQIGALAAQEIPFTISLRGLGAFPSIKHPRVLHLALEDDAKRLTIFQSRLEEGLAAEGFAGKKRAFIPHITLARIRVLQKPETFAWELTKKGNYIAGEFTASTLFLFKSDLTPQGAIYTRLAEYTFTGGIG